MWQDVPPEREDRLVEDIASYIVEHGLEEAAKMFLDIQRPAAVMQEAFIAQVLPFLGIFGTSRDFGNIMLSHPREFIDRLYQRINVLSEEKDKKKLEKENEGTRTSIRTSLKETFKKITHRFSRKTE